MAKSGLIVRLSRPRHASGDITFDVSSLSVPHLIRCKTLRSTEATKQMHLAVIALSDISPILSDATCFETDVKAHSNDESCISWHIMERRRGMPESRPESSPSPAIPEGLSHGINPGDICTLFFLSPIPGHHVEEFEAFSDLEHLPYLSRVPGWKGGARYRVVKSYGEVGDLEGVKEEHVNSVWLGDFGNFTWYREDCDLTGPEYKAAITPWTMRIRDNTRMPNWRYIFQVQQ